ncbi:MAG: transposase [Ectothiorhodospiraceae bacterium AqS1]|nr:transposase [Ectothiorhodospiraceae bacterium AqS1]
MAPAAERATSAAKARWRGRDGCDVPSAARNHPSTRTRKSGWVAKTVGKQALLGTGHRRSGELTAISVVCESRPTVRASLQAAVEPGSVVFTDDRFAYRSIERLPYLHGCVEYGEKEFARKRAHERHRERAWRCSNARSRACRPSIIDAISTNSPSVQTIQTK